jgi:hypothetical protein
MPMPDRAYDSRSETRRSNAAEGLGYITAPRPGDLSTVRLGDSALPEPARSSSVSARVIETSRDFNVAELG